MERIPENTYPVQEEPAAGPVVTNLSYEERVGGSRYAMVRIPDK